ncbi:MAG: hypothetical protein LBS70_03495 [Candidatus Accumulibacter sp.]|jgi:hypothetical protein|nr:hypothetical protein [Accumulibacter sp.]
MKISRTTILAAFSLLLAGAAAGGEGVKYFPPPMPPPRPALDAPFIVTEIPDPQLDGAAAARVALPPGWTVKEAQVLWLIQRFADPVWLGFTLRGPDEAELSFVWRLRFGFHEGLEKQQDEAAAALAEKIKECRRPSDVLVDRPAPVIRPEVDGKECDRRFRAFDEARRQSAARRSGGHVEGGKTFMPPRTAGDFVRWFVGLEANISNLRWKKTARPEALAALWGRAAEEESEKVRRAFAAAPGAPACFAYLGAEPDLAAVSLGFSREGKARDGAFLAALQRHIFSDACTSPAPGKGGKAPRPWTATQWDAGPLLSVSAPEGRLAAHAEEFTAIAGRIEVSPAWEAAANDMADWLSARFADSHRTQCMKPPCFSPRAEEIGQKLKEFFDARTKNPPPVPDARRAFLEAMGQQMTDVR